MGTRRKLEAWWAPRPVPTTGDVLRFSERVTWRVMGLYRRWSVFLFLQALTLVWWLHPSWFPGGLFGWNLVWSDLAIIVEMIVGIAFLGQSMRDAIVIRSELAELRAMHAEEKEWRDRHEVLFQQLAKKILEE